MLAACRPVSTPSPPASRADQSRTPSSWHERGGTIADGVGTTADAGQHGVGQPADPFQHLGPGLVPDDPLELAHHQRERMRSGDRAEDVVRAVDVGHPVAEGLVDRVLERARTGGDRDDLGAEQAHPGHVQGLAAGVLLAHVDGALEAHQRRCRRGGHAVLARPGLGDDALLAEPTGQQRLAQHIVDLVRTGVVEVLALEQYARPAGLGTELGYVGQRRRTPGVVAQQPGEFIGEQRIDARRVEFGRQLVEGGDECFRDEPSAVASEMTGRVGDERARGGVVRRFDGHDWNSRWTKRDGREQSAPPSRVHRRAVAHREPRGVAGWAPAVTRSATACRALDAVTRPSPTSTASAPAAA